MKGWIPVVAIVAILAVAGIGAGYAFTSTLYSEGGDLNVDHISAVDSKGSSLVQVPSVTYSRDGSIYKPSAEAGTVTGTLTLDSADSTPVIRAWVQFQNALTWTTIKTLTITVDSTDYVVFNYAAVEGSLRTSLPTPAIELTPGEHTFKVSVVYKNSMDVNPATYTGDNMKSRIVFLMGASDPLTSS